MKYYLINGKIMKGGDMPTFNNALTEHHKKEYSDWLNSLQECSITDRDLTLIKIELGDFKESEILEVTELISDNYGIVMFKRPAKVESLQTMINNKIEWANKRVEITDKPFTVGQKQVLTFILNEIVNECLKPTKSDEANEDSESQDELWERVISQTEFMDRRGSGIQIGIDYFKKLYTITKK